MKLQKYNFMIVRQDGFIQQITNTGRPNLPKVPEHLTAVSLGFYNPKLIACYYDNGKFYEDAEKTKEIVDPANYVKEDANTTGA